MMGRILITSACVDGNTGHVGFGSCDAHPANSAVHPTAALPIEAAAEAGMVAAPVAAPARSHRSQSADLPSLKLLRALAKGSRQRQARRARQH